MDSISFAELLRDGYTIRIEADAPETAGFDPAEFWVQSGVLCAWAPEFGSFVHPSLTPETIGNHLRASAAEGFRVSVSLRRDQRHNVAPEWLPAV